MAAKNEFAPQLGKTQAASLAHEVNNPLESLLNLLYLVESNAIMSEKTHHYLSLAQEEVHRIARIVREALGRFGGDLLPEQVNIPQLLTSVLDFYHSKCDLKDISVESRFCTDGDLPIYAGPLHQMFSNLLLNAIEAVPRGGRIYARVSEAQEWGGQQRHGLRVTFADNGSGICANNLNNIFNPFFTTKGHEGTGMGLSLVKEIVQKHQGVLRVRTRTTPGRSGSVFAVFLPAA